MAFMQAFRCPLCGMSATTRDQMREHVEEAHLHQARPGQLSGYRRDVATTRGRVLVPVTLEHDSSEQIDLVIDLARRAYLTLDFVAVPAGTDDRCIIAVLRAVTEMACARGVPSARWRLLGVGPISDRLLEDVRDQPPELVCIPRDRSVTAGDAAFATVRRRTAELTHRLGLAVDQTSAGAASAMVLTAPDELVESDLGITGATIA